MTTISTLDLETFKELIKNSKTWSEVMTYFKNNHGYKNIKSNSTAKKRCIKENISFNHFKKRNKILTKTALTKIAYSYNSTSFKTFLIKEGLLKEICSKCQLGNMWQNEPIKLQLEHIDGDHYNNEITNLTLLCPNCHSQTSTWCGKNNNSKKCPDCDKKIRKDSERCHSCFIKKRHKDKKRQEQEQEQEQDQEQEQEQIILNSRNRHISEIIKEIKKKKENVVKIIKKKENVVKIIKKKENKCIDCNSSIYKTSVRCSPCSSIFNGIKGRKVARPSLKQIYKDIEELKTMVAVGLKYGVSCNAVRKWIKKYKN